MSAAGSRSFGHVGNSRSNQKDFSVNPKDYKLLGEVGHGARAVVHRAIYIPTKEVVAIKCLDLDRCNINLDDIRREAHTMCFINHPNVLKSFCSFSVNNNYLWVVMPFMEQGSCLHLMKAAYPDGFEESAICCVLKETLKALDYLHKHGHIHRDVKAGNILLDKNGGVKLGDFGVSACLFENGDRQRARNTFVGTPCWMAPEVLQPGNGYNSKADIWSFGITALELANGHASFSKYFSIKALLMTIQNTPPGLDYDRDKKFSKSFKEMVAMCLVKDQTRRPTAEKLLKHSCFKNTKPPEVCVKKLFAELPPLWTRLKALHASAAKQLILKRTDEEAKSQNEYQKGVSAWNFELEDGRKQASLLSDDDDLAKSKEDEEIFREEFHNENMNGKEKVSDIKAVEPIHEEKFSLNSPSVERMSPSSQLDVLPETKVKLIRHQSQRVPLTSLTVLRRSISEKSIFCERCESEHPPASSILRAPSLSGPLSLSTRASAISLSARNIKSSGGFRDILDEKSKANLVQKGRFSVTSGNIDLTKDIPLSVVSRRSPQGCSLKKSASVGNCNLEPKVLKPQLQPIKELSSQGISSSFIIPQLQNLYMQNSIQQDLIVNLRNSIEAAESLDDSQSGKLPLLTGLDNNGAVESLGSERERLLVIKISELKARLNDINEELNSEKLKHNQLQQKLKAFTGRDQV